MSGMLHVCVSIVLSLLKVFGHRDGVCYRQSFRFAQLDNHSVLFNVTRMRMDSYYAMVSDSDVRRA